MHITSSYKAKVKQSRTHVLPSCTGHITWYQSRSCHPSFQYLFAYGPHMGFSSRQPGFKSSEHRHDMQKVEIIHPENNRCFICRTRLNSWILLREHPSRWTEITSYRLLPSESWHDVSFSSPDLQHHWGLCCACCCSLITASFRPS